MMRSGLALLCFVLAGAARAWAQEFPAIAANPAGNFVIVWESIGQDGQDTGIFGQRFAPIVPLALSGFDVE